MVRESWSRVSAPLRLPCLCSRFPSKPTACTGIHGSDGGGRCGETLPRAGLTSNPKKGRGWESLLWPCKASFWLWWLRISAPQREGSSIIVKCRLSIGGTHTSQRCGEERRGKASVAQPSLPRETDRPHHCPDAGVKPE